MVMANLIASQEADRGDAFGSSSGKIILEPDMDVKLVSFIERNTQKVDRGRKVSHYAKSSGRPKKWGARMSPGALLCE